MSRRGLLLTMTEPPAAMEEEFNAWYETEHLPERLAIPGFRSARRWVCEQVEPGMADAHPAANAVALALGAQPLQEFALPGTLQSRRFVASAGEPRHVMLLELARDGAHSPPLRVYRAMK